VKEIDMATATNARQQQHQYTVPTAPRVTEQNETHTIHLHFDQIGLRVDVTVTKTKSGVLSVEAAYEKLVELKGETAARQIRMAVESVERDLAKQRAMLLKAAGA
jgi:hypothetical protein